MIGRVVRAWRVVYAVVKRLELDGVLGLFVVTVVFVEIVVVWYCLVRNGTGTAEGVVVRVDL